MPEESQNKTNDELAPWQKFEDYGSDKEKNFEAVEFASLGISAYYDDTTQDFVITALQAESDIAQKGVIAGNRIIAAENKKIYGIEDFQTKLKQAAEKGQIELKVKSEQDIDTVTVKLENIK